MFLVPHSSHLTQPLDLCTFGRVKIYTRDQDTYAVSLEEFDEALDDIVDVGNAPRRRAERGKVLAEYIVAILDAFERASTRKLVVSAFRQAGILYDTPDPHRPDRRVTYVDPSEARAVVAIGVFRAVRRVARSAWGQLQVSNLNSNGQSVMRGDGERAAATLARLPHEGAVFGRRGRMSARAQTRTRTLTSVSTIDSGMPVSLSVAPATTTRFPSFSATTTTPSAPAATAATTRFPSFSATTTTPAMVAVPGGTHRGPHDVCSDIHRV